MHRAGRRAAHQWRQVAPQHHAIADDKPRLYAPLVLARVVLAQGDRLARRLAVEPLPPHDGGVEVLDEVVRAAARAARR